MEAAVRSNRLGVLTWITGLIRGREEFQSDKFTWFGDYSSEDGVFTNYELMAWLFDVELVDEQSGVDTMGALAERSHGLGPMVEWIAEVRACAAADTELFEVSACLCSRLHSLITTMAHVILSLLL